MTVDCLTDGNIRFRCGFLDRDWEIRDCEIQEVDKAGRLDFLVREAAEAKNRKNLGEP